MLDAIADGVTMRNFVLRCFLGTCIISVLSGCSTQPLQTNLSQTMRVSTPTQTQQQQAVRTTLSSKVLSQIAQERVMGQKAKQSLFGTR